MSNIILSTGSHGRPGTADNPNGQVCLMEAVAFIAGERHTDKPRCVSPVLGVYGRILNDTLDDVDRRRLVPLIPELIGTESDGRDDARWFALLDDVVRLRLPRALEATTSDWELSPRLRVARWADLLRHADPVTPGTLVTHLNAIRRDRTGAGITVNHRPQWTGTTTITGLLTTTFHAVHRLHYAPNSVRRVAELNAGRFASSVMRSAPALVASADERIALFERMIRVEV